MVKRKFLQSATDMGIALSLFLSIVSVSPAKEKVGLHSHWRILLDGQSLRGWKPLDTTVPNDWRICASTKLNSQNPRFFSIKPGKGILVNGEEGKTVNLISEARFGDIHAHIEFMIPKGSNSGVYFMGLYEIQVMDSFGKTELAFSDCGGIYSRWIDQKTVGGTPPRVNASRPPGKWQSFDVQFRAPRFDASGRKTENARFLKVIHNGVVIHENVEVEGPTRSAMDAPESAEGPLMLQGDHGPVAYRNIRVRPMHN